MHAWNDMNKWQKLSLVVAGSLIAATAAIAGINGIRSKLNEVKELNGQLAEASLQKQTSSEQEAAAQVKQTSSAQEAAAQVKQEAAAQAEPGRKAIEAAAEQSSVSHQPEPSAGKLATASPSPPAASEQPTPAPKPQESPSGSAAGPGAAEDRVMTKQDMDSAMTAKLESLRASCEAASDRLVAQIKQELASNKEATLAALEREYLDKVFAAEADCDARFHKLLGEAKAQYRDAGLDERLLPNWGVEYENAKAEARSEAMVDIAGAMEGSSIHNKEG